MDRTYAYRHIEAAELKDNLLPIGNIPANEAQARPLTKLNPDQQRKAWQQVLDNAPETEDGHRLITAKVVSEVVTSMVDVKPSEPRPFDADAEEDKVVDFLRNTMDRWPEELRPRAAHWIREILDKEYGL